MRHLLLYGLALTLFLGCKKEDSSRENGLKVDIYLLKSFAVNVDQTTTPFTISVVNAVLADAPLVANKDIAYYTKATRTFKLKRDIKAVIQNYGPDKAFTVTVDGQPVYYGAFHPGYLSSIVFGLAMIDPILLNDRNLPIQFATIDGNSFLLQLDKRNDERILNALRATRRLR